MNDEFKHILIVDDNEAIHNDLRSILNSKKVEKSTEIQALEKELFGDDEVADDSDKQLSINYEIDDAYQGEEAIQMVKVAVERGNPYSLIFMDVRMPPGIDGIQTIQKIWEEYPDIEMVICTAYSDYSWDQIIQNFGPTEHLYFIKKPFDQVAVKQITLSLTTKWEAARKNNDQVKSLQSEIKKRTSELQKMINHLGNLRNEMEAESVVKNDFLFNKSHEIRTPLNGILGMTDLLLDTELSDEQRKYAETIKISSDSLWLIMNDVLDYSKIEAGELELESIEFNIRTLMEIASELISIKIKDKELELIILIHYDVPEVLLGDPAYIFQILQNLVDNAMKYTNKGEFTVSISCDNKLNSNRTETKTNQFVMLNFDVNVKGIELSNVTKEKLLKPITDLLNSAMYKFDSTGLAISKKLCELMGGDMGIKNIEAENATLWFSTRNKLPETHEMINISSANTLLGARCLIVCDNAVCRKVYTLYINHWGGKTDDASSIDEAVEKLHTNRDTMGAANIIIVDFKDSDLNTYKELANKIKRHKNLAKIPLVCVSSKGHRCDANIVQKHGYNAYLTKPLKKAHFYNAIAMVKRFQDVGKYSEDYNIITKYIVDSVGSDQCNALIIVECPENRKNLVKILNRIGIRCDIVEQYDDVIEAFSQKKYNLIFLDCLLPQMDSFMIAEQLRGINSHLHAQQPDTKLPIIGISNNISNDDREKYFVDFIMGEPFEQEEIIKTLKRFQCKREVFECEREVL